VDVEMLADVVEKKEMERIEINQNDFDVCETF
jgi:hypothetical protein